MEGAMSQKGGAARQLRTWERVAYQPGGGTPFLLYVVYGDLPTAPVVDGARYRTTGLGTLSVYHYRPDCHPEACGQWLQRDFGDVLQRYQPTLMKAATEASGCMVIRGEPADARTLNYLRDAVGFITYLTDNGAVAILDPQSLRICSPTACRRRVAARRGHRSVQPLHRTPGYGRNHRRRPGDPNRWPAAWHDLPLARNCGRSGFRQRAHRDRGAPALRRQRGLKAGMPPASPGIGDISTGHRWGWSHGSTHSARTGAGCSGSRPPGGVTCARSTRCSRPTGAARQPARGGQRAGRRCVQLLFRDGDVAPPRRTGISGEEPPLPSVPEN